MSTHSNPKTLYVSDMDGTLLNNNSVLSQETIEKLNSLIDKGAAFTVATARTPATVTSLMKDVNANLPFIVMAGCAQWQPKEKKYKETRFIETTIVKRIADIFELYGNTPFIYNKDGNRIVVNHTTNLSQQERDFIEPRIKTPLKRLETVEKLLERTGEYDGVMLIFSMGKFDSLRKIADEIDKKGIPCTCNCYRDIFDTEQGIIDIYLEGTTKASAIKRLAHEIGADRIVCFGDNLNDIAMMEAADWSVAVSNAFEEVKAYANEVIGSNEEKAVVNWIEKDYNGLLN